VEDIKSHLRAGVIDISNPVTWAMCTTPTRAPTSSTLMEQDFIDG